MNAGTSRALGFAAEALRLAGRPQEAREQLDAAFAFARLKGERVHLPELLISQGRIAAAAGETAAARAAFAEAGAESRRQGAVWSELAAAIACCELDEARPEDREALAGICTRLTDAEDTIALRRARALQG